MTQILRPTVGRIILFRVAFDIIRPAIITEVLSFEQISLEVFGTDGRKNYSRVYRGTRIHEWDWMEFTKAQEEKSMAGNVTAEIETEQGMDATGKEDVRAI